MPRTKECSDDVRKSFGEKVRGAASRVLKKVEGGGGVVIVA